MKRPYELIRIGVVACSLAAASAYAQSPTSPAGPNGAGSPASSGQTVPGTDMNNPSHYDNRDHGFNFGWLGLVGLAGLLGLRRAPRHDYADPRSVNNTG